MTNLQLVAVLAIVAVCTGIGFISGVAVTTHYYRRQFAEIKSIIGELKDAKGASQEVTETSTVQNSSVPTGNASLGATGFASIFHNHSPKD